VPLTTIPLPYGLRDVKITPYTDAAATTLAGSSIDLPYGRKLSFSAAEDFEELRGDDKVITVRGKGEAVDWELEGGGISLEACAAMYGGTVTTLGTTPAQVKTLSKSYTQVRPYFKIEGRAISDSGGDFHVVLYKCRATGEMEGELGDGAFWLTGASGTALPATLTAKVDAIYDIVHNETEAVIP
jgi:hypothetical protein